MDPNANLSEQRRIAQEIIDEWDSGDVLAPSRTQMEEDAHRLAELVLALDAWIAGGGFLPHAWAKAYATGRLHE